MSWRDYWNSDNPIYVNRRHIQWHYRRIATDLVALIDELAPNGKPIVLDYGCGQALEADRVGARCETLLLAETASTVVEQLRTRYAGNPRIRVLPADEVRALRDASLDIFIVNSVLQYVSPAEFAQVLAIARAKLKPGGMLALADVIPRNIGPLTDISALLRFAREGGFFAAALGGLVRTALSDYRKLRNTLGLTFYEEQEMLGLLSAAGFTPTRRQPNLGPNPARMTFVARTATAPQAR